ncbi:hypothetical protein ACFQU9_14270 [Actinomadura namibiensis]|uniref:hypothetical protein n=1 Tax=Actinomadura kijaniata TaxID=46161 RepID=UPI00361E5049
MASALVAVLTVAGCSGSDVPSASSSASPTSTARAATTAASPSPRNTSAFCLNLSTIKVGVVIFRSDVSKAIEGQPLDFAELRRKATLIKAYSRGMRESAPPDIAKQFDTVLDAVATSARALKEGGSTRAVVEPLFGKRNRAAFDAVQKYECR